ncbi:hypothetical protein HHX47_DHR4000764, partial [Lentinula edodes]
LDTNRFILDLYKICSKPGVISVSPVNIDSPYSWDMRRINCYTFSQGSHRAPLLLSLLDASAALSRDFDLSRSILVWSKNTLFPIILPPAPTPVNW